MLDDPGHSGGAPVSPVREFDRWGCVAAGSGPEGVAGAAADLFVALEMAAFNTCAKEGLIPQARHGGRGV